MRAAKKDGRSARTALLSTRNSEQGDTHMEKSKTLAVDIGGTGIKAALLDENGQMIGKRSRVPTPPKPVAPEVLTATIDEAVSTLGGFDRASVGFPGAVREGRVLTAPNLGTEVLAGFDLQNELSKRWGKPVRVMNDADVQGFGAIKGKGVEFVLTLGTGAGTSLFYNGRIMPHLELAHHPVKGSMTYDEYVGRAALEKIGKKKWNKRVERIIGILRTVVNFDHLYIGGGNSKAVKFELPADVSLVSNMDGLLGGIALWRTEGPARRGTGNGARGRAPKEARPTSRRRAAKAMPQPKVAKAATPRQPRRRSPATAAAAQGESAGDGHARTLTASQPRTAPAFSVPFGACDCHVHVFGTAGEFRFTAKRGYTPPPASADELLKLQRGLHLSRVVIVQPSVYGADNSCTLDGMRRLGDRARGVAVIDEATNREALDQMHRAGVRGIRVNLETAGETDPDAARHNLLAAIERVAPLGWHVQIYTRLSVIDRLAEEISQTQAPIVIDHFGGAVAAGGTGQPGFATLLSLVEHGHAYVKLSAAYRSSEKAPAYDDVAPLAQALIGANPDRIVWGTDWPHPHAAAPGKALKEAAPFYDIDDGLALNQLAEWAPDAAIRRKILVDNPARLYDFPPL
jgi:predicted TIM-barrel fold metal-dependent hydrolase/predicted NBD/HSP70 family sugar kinase